ncbi:hypothetical protein PC116_g17602 [Phytophthora cactorum]|nr:hypothetical protein PC120_g27307 [Phytophthora cactorum]KAG3007744.1 hypothetical protein PC119_g14459 [Phytophthora cactorum]KAG3125108.1 hypothetical protein C6341_g25918 [Phytophthora cactorum]KAG4037299.1 hypothetical protein PC123_g27134 [Phytophthora cactorum]KAG4234238.1 hypothetical protein PC116_g17602 [Phytophthora cactorum]
MLSVGTLTAPSYDALQLSHDASYLFNREILVALLRVTGYSTLLQSGNVSH